MATTVTVAAAEAASATTGAAVNNSFAECVG
jgi:hypothetical protein